MNRDDAGKLIPNKMPGFRLARAVAAPDAADEDRDMKIDNGPSIAALRQKFLADDGADAADAGEADFAPADPNSISVRVEPDDGGPAKTADVSATGEVKIVQG